jgi:serine/threonine-protein kinase
MSADRNLLFGVLALQMDFVTRDQLISGMNAWVLNKTRSLGDILVEQGALAADEHALLDQLVEKHLERHGRDAERSLAALPVTAVIRKAIVAIPDKDIQASAAGLSSPETTGPVAFSRPGTSRYRVLRPHALGGLGEVFVAEDTELVREVALKEIRQERADEPHRRRRFLLEAEVNGRLEHPNIVPVYGLGQYEDGRPYYAMRLIQGDTLKDAIDRFHQADIPGRDPGERALSLRRLLGQFVAVCNAVAYAHSRGVIHRDLKPANVMLGKFGETLLVDWGLAKVVGRDGGEAAGGEATLRPLSGGELLTQTGMALGTPAYTSPEQAAGHLNLVTPASDVYGLGATLYCLLTGRAPVEGNDQGEVLRKAQTGDWKPPGKVKKWLPAALDAVCRKAISLRPEDRYATAKELAEDVERWLADEPVKTWPEPLGARTARWARRHPAPVAAILAGVLVAGLLVVTSSDLLKGTTGGVGG